MPITTPGGDTTFIPTPPTSPLPPLVAAAVPTVFITDATAKGDEEVDAVGDGEVAKFVTIPCGEGTCCAEPTLAGVAGVVAPDTGVGPCEDIPPSSNTIVGIVSDPTVRLSRDEVIPSGGSDDTAGVDEPLPKYFEKNDVFFGSTFSPFSTFSAGLVACKRVRPFSSASSRLRQPPSTVACAPTPVPPGVCAGDGLVDEAREDHLRCFRTTTAWRTALVIVCTNNLFVSRSVFAISFCKIHQDATVSHYLVHFHCETVAYWF